MQRKIVHVITGLEVGGAEMMLYKLISRSDRTQFKPTVVSLTTVGPVGQRICEQGIPVIPLRMRGSFSAVAGVLRLARLLRVAQADLIQTWMYHADLLGGFAAALVGEIPVVWGIRQSNFDPQASKRTTRWIAKACARLSRRLPTAIIACSDRARRMHIDLGYPSSVEVIPNGFDPQLFKPNTAARRQVRAELGLPADAVLIGLVARLDPQKDHLTFVQAAALVAVRHPEVHFVLCGPGVTTGNAQLKGWIQSAGIAERCHLLGSRNDMPKLTAGFDIAVSSSAWGEGFSNAIGEAMACAVPCVVTDVGDSAEMVAGTGRVVAPRDPAALADAIAALVALGPEGREDLGAEARRRVGEHYELGQIVGRYEEKYLEILDGVRNRRPV